MAVHLLVFDEVHEVHGPGWVWLGAKDSACKWQLGASFFREFGWPCKMVRSSKKTRSRWKGWDMRYVDFDFDIDIDVMEMQVASRCRLKVQLALWFYIPQLRR